MTGASSPVYFDATLTPNTALSPRAFLVVMGLVGLFSFVGGMMFLQLGAFPVIGWFGLDALAIWLAGLVSWSIWVYRIWGLLLIVHFKFII